MHFWRAVPQMRRGPPQMRRGRPGLVPERPALKRRPDQITVMVTQGELPGR